jgi:hypothetical protein
VYWEWPIGPTSTLITEAAWFDTELDCGLHMSTLHGGLSTPPPGIWIGRGPRLFLTDAEFLALREKIADTRSSR